MPQRRRSSYDRRYDVFSSIKESMSFLIVIVHSEGSATNPLHRRPRSSDFCVSRECYVTCTLQ